jgi:biofilm PGA synthesis N-glycosyltransferase PgaC
LAVAGIGLSWGPVHAPPELDHKPPPPPAQTEINAVDASPFIGTGPLARLVRVERMLNGYGAIDPLTGEDLYTLNQADIDSVGSSRYAIYRYGYDDGVHRTIELTFDDGPDPTWTPQILDVLGANHVPATFFVIGSEVVRQADIVAREQREGHAIGNHTMTHPELSSSTIQQELVTTDRVIAGTVGLRTGLARLPYDGYGPSGHDTEGGMLLDAQELGYVVSIEDFDTNDWQFGDPATRPRTPILFPPDTMDNITMLLHDGGGNRAATVAYLKRLIPWARAHGYTFHSLTQVSQDVSDRSVVRGANLWTARRSGRSKRGGCCPMRCCGCCSGSPWSRSWSGA